MRVEVTGCAVRRRPARADDLEARARRRSAAASSTSPAARQPKRKSPPTCTDTGLTRARAARRRGTPPGDISASSRRERDDEDDVDAGLGDERELVGEREQLRRGGLRRDDLVGIAVERDRDRVARRASRASATVSASSAWWPRCTPSKTPIATTAGPSDAMSGSHATTPAAHRAPPTPPGMTACGLS